MATPSGYTQGTRANTNYQLHRIACCLEEIRDELRKADLFLWREKIETKRIK